MLSPTVRTRIPTAVEMPSPPLRVAATSMPALRVLIVSRGTVQIKAGSGGAETVCLQLAGSLASAGHHVSLLADIGGHTPIPAGVDHIAAPSRMRARVERLPGGFGRWILQHLVGNWSSARHVKRVLTERGDFDVVHCHGNLTTVLVSRTVRRAGAALIYTEHDSTPWSCRYRGALQRMVRKLIYGTVNKRAYRAADRVVTQYEAHSREIIDRWGVPESKVSWIRNGADVNLFRPQTDTESVIARDHRVTRFCLFVGTLVARKSPDLVLQALVEVPEVQAVFAGDGPLRRKLEHQARQLGVAERAVFLGKLSPEELSGLYGEALMLVLPSLSETSPLVIIEAMASGIPIVASRIGGVGALVEDWQTGFLVKPGDAGQLAMAMRFVAGDEQLRHRMGENGRSRFLDHFPWDIVANQYVDLYRREADGRGSSPSPTPMTVSSGAVIGELSV
jgi:glycosyltransferase involved in cell wall biosynthesis